jgi:hypothetical protein
MERENTSTIKKSKQKFKGFKTKRAETMKNMTRFKLFIALLAMVSVALNSCKDTMEKSEKLERPFIWVKASERDGILKKVENNDWAKELFNTLKERADKTTSTSLEERREKLMVLPLVWSADSSKAPTIKRFTTDNPHDRSWKKAKGIAEVGKVLDEAVDNAIMYYLTEDPAYAEAAAEMKARLGKARFWDAGKP